MHSQISFLNEFCERTTHGVLNEGNVAADEEMCWVGETRRSRRYVQHWQNNNVLLIVEQEALRVRGGIESLFCKYVSSRGT